MKEKFLAQGDGKEVDLAQLQDAISKTEDGIRVRTKICSAQCYLSSFLPVFVVCCFVSANSCVILFRWHNIQ